MPYFWPIFGTFLMFFLFFLTQYINGVFEQKIQKITNFKTALNWWRFFWWFLMFFVIFCYFWLQKHEDIWKKITKIDKNWQKSTLLGFYHNIGCFFELFFINFCVFLCFLISYILVFFDKKTKKTQKKHPYYNGNSENIEFF